MNDTGSYGVWLTDTNRCICGVEELHGMEFRGSIAHVAFENGALTFFCEKYTQT